MRLKKKGTCLTPYCDCGIHEWREGCLEALNEPLVDIHGGFVIKIKKVVNHKRQIVFITFPEQSAKKGSGSDSAILENLIREVNVIVFGAMETEGDME